MLPNNNYAVSRIGTCFTQTLYRLRLRRFRSATIIIMTTQYLNKHPKWKSEEQKNDIQQTEHTNKTNPSSAEEHTTNEQNEPNYDDADAQTAPEPDRFNFNPKDAQAAPKSDIHTDTHQNVNPTTGLDH